MTDTDQARVSDGMIVEWDRHVNSKRMAYVDDGEADAIVLAHRW